VRHPKLWGQTVYRHAPTRSTMGTMTTVTPVLPPGELSSFLHFANIPMLHLWFQTIYVLHPKHKPSLRGGLCPTKRRRGAVATQSLAT